MQADTVVSPSTTGADRDASAAADLGEIVDPSEGATPATTPTGAAHGPAGVHHGSEAGEPRQGVAQMLPGVPGPPAVDDHWVRLSFSRVAMYETCPLKFRFAYVDELPTPPSPHLSWGSTIHKVLELWWDRKLPTPPPVEDMYRALYDHWDDTGFAGMAREDKIAWYQHARTVLARHHERYSPTYTPAVATEQWFEIDVGNDVVVVGSIDHVARTPSGGIGIVDWKTNRKAKPRERVASSLQLAIYALAARELWGYEPEWVALDFVVPGVRVTVERRHIDVDGALATLHRVADQIRAEAFAPRPSRLCEWCDFRSLCPAFEGGDGPDVAGLAVVELAELRRRRAKDERRMARLESLIREQLGEGAIVELGSGVPRT